MLIYHIITIEPEIFPGILGTSLIGKARGKYWDMQIYNLRDYGIGARKNVDDAPYGGGPGLIIKFDVVSNLIDDIISKINIDAAYYLSPKGILLSQPLGAQIIKASNIILLCGRFEGIDQRIIDRYNLIEISIGDYILTNGDLAATVLMDCTIRLIPGVLGNYESTLEDSFSFDYSYDYPDYTRPRSYKGLMVPDVLLSGDHKKIAKWRNLQSKLNKNER